MKTTDKRQIHTELTTLLLLCVMCFFFSFFLDLALSVFIVQFCFLSCESKAFLHSEMWSNNQTHKDFFSSIHYLSLNHFRVAGRSEANWSRDRGRIGLRINTINTMNTPLQCFIVLWRRNKGNHTWREIIYTKRSGIEPLMILLL